MKGVKFGEYHTYDSWGLLQTPNWEIGLPEVKEKKINIEGADGDQDYTDFFGGVKYGNRALKFEFVYPTLVTGNEFMQMVSEISDALHGQKLKVVLDDDTEHYYIGRAKVTGFNVKKGVGTIEITVDAEPYKLKKDVSGAVINLAGKNLINLDEAVIGGTNTWVKTATGFTYTQTAGGGSYVYFNVPLEAGKTYTFSVNGANLAQTSLYIYTDRIYGTAYKTSNAGAHCTFTPDKSGVYVCAVITNSTATSAEFSEIMLAEASSVGTYEAYDSTVKTREVTIVGARMAAIPKIYATQDGIITSKGKTVKLTAHTSVEVPEFQIEQGNNLFTASAAGRVLISWQEGRM